MVERNYVHKIERGVHQVHVEIDIETPASHVYSVLTDFEALRQWSSSWVANEGAFELGKPCVAHYRLFGREMRFEHEIMELEVGRKFAWSGTTVLGMRDYHLFEMRPVTDTSCILIQEDLTRGSIAPLVGRMVQRSNMKAYKAFNKEIKARAEATWVGSNA